MLTKIEGGRGAGALVKAGQFLKVVDVEGSQICDLMAYTPDGADQLSNGRSFDYNSKISLSVGDSLWSYRSEKLLTVVADNVGKHDFLYAACSVEMYRIEYGHQGHHANCTENLTNALREFGIEPGRLPTPFNIFQNATIDDGRLVLAGPLSKPGDAIVFEAHRDLIVALSACPAPSCNAGKITSIAFEVRDTL